MSKVFRKTVLAGALLCVMLCVFGCAKDTGPVPATPTVTPTPEGWFEIPPDIDPEILQFLLPSGNQLTPGVTPAGSSNNATPTSALPNRIRVNSRGYSAETIRDYFSEVALNTEYGSNDNCVHKWNEPLTVYVDGRPTAQDRIVLDDIFRTMNGVRGFPGISETTSERDANIVIHFADDAEYTRITPETITDSSDGFATCWWSGYYIFEAVIGIRTSMSQNERNSVIWEELVQATGLQNDSYTYPDSLFYQGYNEVQGPNELDWILFEILYHPEIKAGMTEAECSAVIKSVLE
ncbi:MAG: DUF2927 domain-containing protein [Lachnospiraceae bacterium]|nr:DUF2927 domain-containing protein [Lachnospiraceae bacterium]